MYARKSEGKELRRGRSLDNRTVSSSFGRGSTTIIFTLKNEVGGLIKALKLFQEKHVNLIHIESRKSKRRNSDFEIFVDCDTDHEQFKELAELLRKHTDIVEISPLDGSALPEDDVPGVPWFPKKISDLDLCVNRVLMYGSELDADHPGFKDNVYRKRRQYFSGLAKNYKHGEPIPRVDYTAEEVRTWGVVFRELHKLYPSHACREYLKNLPLLTKYCKYSEDNIPQLEDVSHFLKGVVRVQPSFAQFSQELGLASLGASDDDVNKLATCYFFTVEFGLCKQDGRLSAYGAGLLSSVSELQHALSSSANILPFDPTVTCNQECMITTFQHVYYVADSFEEAKNKMREFAKTLRRPFTIRYDPYTQSVDVLEDTNNINSMVKDIRHELDIVEDALNRLSKKLQSV
ncbi:tryptophan 5-hydroxylase 1-like [Neolamprologus brichardi]|uniref:tryptophan 5-hydroxylase 1-like n=1 Tax=Neolamprologus brichardi TaxID=32507 RepID=UPI0003EBE834|nr:tryptophan 5-hydroxylase 1-like [Neolamprologus brichardi]